jgi:hypothetical protein
MQAAPEKGLTPEDVVRLRDQFKLAVTTGGGTGIGMDLAVCFTANLVLGIDHASEPPTDDEATLLASYQEYTVRLWSHRADERLSEFPVRLEGHNSSIFRKDPEVGWQYRRVSWTMGPYMVPAADYNKDKQDYTTLAHLLLFYINDLVPRRWNDWLRERLPQFAVPDDVIEAMGR